MDLRETVGLIEGRAASAQLCVIRDGRVVADRGFGADRREPFLLFSAGKPLTAMLVHRLAARGAFGLDDPIAAYWPEFGAAGKQDITVRQVLQHRSGLPYARSLQRDALLAIDWRRSVRALAAASPHYPPGSVPAYHVLSFGFLLGELVQRVTGRPYADVLRSELLDPLGMTSTRIGGVSRALVGRPGLRPYLFNRRWFRDAIIPAATVVSTAADLARFYAAMLADPLAVAAREPSSDGETDRVLRMPIRWSAGFQLGGPAEPRRARPWAPSGEARARPDPPARTGPRSDPFAGPGRARPMGRTSSPLTFGHNGSNACIGWADPTRGLVVAYLTNRLQGGLDASPHQCAVSDAIIAAADRA